jgi:hypothetical protein
MNLTESILLARPGAQWSQVADDYATLTWNGPGEKPTLEELQLAWDNRPAPPVTVNRRAFRLALVQAGLFTGVVEAISGIEAETDRLSAQVWWEDTLVFHRDHPLIATFATVLNKTTAEVDALFAAAKLLDQ